jgi:RNA polymerase sigma-70 factor (ECF subfamily)
MGRIVPIRRVAGTSGELSDEALLAACGTGDRAALGALFDRFSIPVYRFVARLRSVDEAAHDDVVQATFLELPRSASHFQGRSSVKTWILGVASNAARHHQRSEQRRRAHQDQFASLPVVPPRLPDVELERRQLLARLEDALATLPHDQQVAFILCDLEQVPGVDVARGFGIPEGTLWRRLHVARKTLRAILSPPKRSP